MKTSQHTLEMVQKEKQEVEFQIYGQTIRSTLWEKGLTLHFILTPDFEGAERSRWLTLDRHRMFGSTPQQVNFSFDYCYLVKVGM